MTTAVQRDAGRATRLPACALLVAVTFALCIASAAPAADDSNTTPLSSVDRFFLERVRPLLAARCWSCHGPDKAEGGLRDLPRDYLVFVSIQVTLALVGVVTSNRRFHKAFAVLWPLYTLGYVSITTLAEIAA